MYIFVHPANAELFIKITFANAYNSQKSKV